MARPQAGRCRMSPAEFDARLRAAKPGEAVCYHHGHCLKGVRDTGKHALRAYYQGKAHLVQKRNADGFDYLAIKRRGEPPAVDWRLSEFVERLFAEAAER